MTDPQATPSKNVIDYYKTWEMEAIKADLDTNRSKMVSLCMNLTGDFNKASVIRNSNAFLGNKVYLVGRRKYNRKGTVGTHLYENVCYAETADEIIAELKADGYTIFAVDNVEGATNLETTEFPEKSAFLYGEEQAGLSAEHIALCDKVVFIPQRGSVRSINVAVAAGIIMYEYSKQNV